jgi:hypothetical protein
MKTLPLLVALLFVAPFGHAQKGVFDKVCVKEVGPSRTPEGATMKKALEDQIQLSSKYALSDCSGLVNDVFEIQAVAIKAGTVTLGSGIAVVSSTSILWADQRLVFVEVDVAELAAPSSMGLNDAAISILANFDRSKEKALLGIKLADARK